MHTLKRRLYKRGASYEVTIPMPMLFGLDLNKKHSIIFLFSDNKWVISFDEKQKSNSISRSLYKRGSSFETTIPLQLLLTQSQENPVFASFKFDQKWYIEFTKDE